MYQNQYKHIWFKKCIFIIVVGRNWSVLSNTEPRTDIIISYFHYNMNKCAMNINTYVDNPTLVSKKCLHDRFLKCLLQQEFLLHIT